MYGSWERGNFHVSTSPIYITMNIDYNNCSVNSNRFDIRNHVEFDQNGRALCPSCSPNHSNNKKTLSLVPNTDGAYKCFRDCTTEEIREALGQPKTKIVPTALAKTPPKQNVTKSEQEIIRMHSDLMGLGDNALKAIRWLANRGITTDIVKKYRLGITRTRSKEKMTYAVTIPIPSYLDQRYYLKKRIAPWDREITEAPDYKPWSQYGVPATTFFTYLPEKATETWLCEGEWDAILLGWLVQQHRNDVAVACFTCGCSTVPPDHELDRLPGNVTIFYDRNDNLSRKGTRAGEEGAKKVAKALNGRGKIAQVPMPENSTVKGWDITDAIQHGYQLESFERAAMEAEEYQTVVANIFRKESRTLEEVFDQAPDYIDWLVPDLLTSNELYCLAAPPRRGKSLLALALAKAVASGKRFLGRPCQKGKVIYIGREDPDDKVKERMIAQQWEREHMKDVIFNNKFTLDQLPELIEYVKESQPSLIIFDTLSRIQTNNGKENSAEMADTLAPLQDLAQAENVCVVVVHHTKKETKDNLELTDIFDSVRGSGAIRSTCRGMLILSKQKEKYKLVAENGRTSEQALEVYLDASTLTWQVKGDWLPPEVNLTQKATILDWFAKHNHGSIDQIYAATLIPRNNIHKVLTRLVSEEVIARTGKQRNTRYFLLPDRQDGQAEPIVDRSIAYKERATPQRSTIFKNDQKSDQSDHNSNGLLQPDQTDHFLPEKEDSVQLGNKSDSTNYTVGDVEINPNASDDFVVKLGDQKVIKEIRNSPISCDQNSHTTNFFDENRSEEEKEEESEALQGVWHKRLGYVLVQEVRGSKLTVRQPGERKSQTIYLRGCDSRREYQTYCKF